MSNDAIDRIAELIKDAANQARSHQTKIMVCYDDESSIYDIDGDGDLSEKRDIHIKVIAEPSG